MSHSAVSRLLVTTPAASRAGRGPSVALFIAASAGGPAPPRRKQDRDERRAKNEADHRLSGRRLLVLVPVEQGARMDERGREEGHRFQREEEANETY